MKLTKEEIDRMWELAQEAVGADPEVVIEGDRNAVKFLFYLSPERILALCTLALSSLDQGWRDVREEMPTINTSLTGANYPKALR